MSYLQSKFRVLQKQHIFLKHIDHNIVSFNFRGQLAFKCRGLVIIISVMNDAYSKCHLIIIDTDDVGINVKSWKHFVRAINSEKWDLSWQKPFKHFIVSKANYIVPCTLFIVKLPSNIFHHKCLTINSFFPKFSKVIPKIYLVRAQTCQINK